MKTTNDYITILRKYLRTKADAYGITKIGIFGSVARNEQTEDSDVDVCVEMKKPDLFILVHIKEELQELFGKPVDIVRLRNNMNPMLLKQIKRDGIYAWRRTLILFTQTNSFNYRKNYQQLQIYSVILLLTTILT